MGTCFFVWPVGNWNIDLLKIIFSKYHQGSVDDITF